MTTSNTTLQAQVINQLEGMQDTAIINIYQAYADENRYKDIHDLSQDTINDLFESAWDAVAKSNHKGFNDNDSYFVFNGYGLMSSFNYLTDDNCPIDISELAQWIIDNESYSEYDIEVITSDDMIASIEDNINDDENMLAKLADYLTVLMDNDSCEDNIYDVMNELGNYDYNQLQDIITLLGIDL